MQLVKVQLSWQLADLVNSAVLTGVKQIQACRAYPATHQPKGSNLPPTGLSYRLHELPALIFSV